MTTVEKLFVQIFERKNSIIQQVKQQTDLYSQHLASKLLIDGIPPPPWLWNPNRSSDVQKVLNKEELISEILLPRPQPAGHFSSAHCSLYNKPVVAGNHDELLVGSSKEISHNRDDIGDRQDIAASFPVTNNRCTSNFLPELDFSVNSPPDETEARISNIYTVPDKSLARIQRSRSRQKALELRCSGNAEAKNRSSQKNDFVGSSARSRDIFGSEKVNKFNELQELVDPCVTRYENCGDGESDKGDHRNKEKSTKLKSSAEEASSGVGSLKLDSCSESIQNNASILLQYEEEFTKCDDQVNELPEAISTPNVSADSFGKVRAEDSRGEKGKGTNICDGRISQPSSSQQQCCMNEGSEVGISIQSAEADCGIFAHSMQQFVNANHCEEITKPSEGLALDRATSENTSNDEVLPTVSYTSTLADQRDKTTFSSSTEKSLEVNEVHRTSSGKAIMPCPDTCNINQQQRNTEAVSGKELISHELVKDPLVNFQSNINPAGSECLVSKSSSDCLIVLEPKQLDFSDSEECNLDKCFSLSLENIRRQKSPEDAFGTLPDPQVTSDNINNTMPENITSAEPEISTEAEELYRESFESTSEEHVHIQLEECSPHINEDPLLETSQGGSEIVHHSQNSNFKHQIDVTQSNAFKCSDAEDHVSCHCKEESKCPSELQTHEEGQHRTEGKVKSKSAKSAFKRKNLVLDYNTGESDLVTCGLFESPLDTHKPEELKFGNKSQPLKMGSWPRTKRRKIEDQETGSCSALPSYSVGMHYSSQSDYNSIDLEKVGSDVETVQEHASPMRESTNEETNPVPFTLNEEMEPLTKPQNRESGALCSQGLNEHLGSSSSSKLQQVAVPIFSEVSQECLVWELEMPADLRKDNNEEYKVQGHMVNTEGTEGLSCTEKTIVEGKSYLAVDGQLPNYFQEFPYKGDLELVGVDESSPELEGFIIDSETESEEVEISENHINFHELDLPRTSIERASILEKICKSASQFLPTNSSSFKLHGSCKPYQSVPNGLLECTDLARFSALNKDVDEQFRSDCMDDVNGCLEVLSFPDSLPYSVSQFGWDSHNPYRSPVAGKLWERMSSRASSSGKTLSSNPELTCFPIEEDPSVSEENENFDEVPDKIQDEIISSITNSAKQEPLADITRACFNASSPVPVAGNFLSKDSGDSAPKEADFNDSHSKSKGKVGNHGREKSLNKENDILSFGGNTIKKSEASLNIRFSKVNSSCKTSSRKGRKKLSEKEPRCNNIVSNVTSFIPLVQQKQAAAQCTGKRDIKVKALEAAEAAKRLEEKKENERKMRKEALKIERARLEQEHLKQMELEKKRKEEERKKKDADIVAKKRQREEEEKKEKDRKRKRLEEARQQQREDGKLRLEKVEKAKKRCTTGEKDNKKEARNDSKRSQVSLKESRDNIPLEKPETNLRPNGFTSHVQDAGISVEACRTSTDSGDHNKAMTAFNESPKANILAAQMIKEKSYEISPYQCSDDEQEEEEEEDIPNKKSIPSWASKSCVALVLPLQQGIDPDTIFPPDSFCSTDEVLHTRKPQHKQQLAI